MFTLSVCAQSLFALSVLTLGSGSPCVGEACPAPGVDDTGAMKTIVVDLQGVPQEQEARPARRATRRRVEQQSPEPEKRAVDAPQQAVRFEAAVYRLALSAEKVVQINAADLAQATSLAEFDAAVRMFGEARVMYRVDQTINIGQSPRIRIVADQPYVTGTVTAQDGRPRRTIARDDVGVEFRAFGAWVPGRAGKCMHFTLDVEVSMLDESAIEIGTDLAAQTFRKNHQRYGGPVELGQPLVLLNLDGACTDKSGQAVALLTRVVLHAATP